MQSKEKNKNVYTVQYARFLLNMKEKIRKEMENKPQYYWVRSMLGSPKNENSDKELYKKFNIT